MHMKRRLYDLAVIALLAIGAVAVINGHPGGRLGQPIAVNASPPFPPMGGAGVTPQLANGPVSPPSPESSSSQPGMLTASGGPYLALATIKAQAATSLGCATTPGSQVDVVGGICDSVSATPILNHAEAMKFHSDWGTPGGVGPTREVYLVTVHGHIKFFPKTVEVNAANGVWVDHFNIEIDATTGSVLGQGTLGSPLS
jgi:hypothetical protein